MLTIVTAALQRQYSQTEFIFWITLIYSHKFQINEMFFFHICTVHLDIIKVLFIHQLMHH